MNLDLSRHYELFNPADVEVPIHIIGVGATGSWLALSLAKLGLTNVTLWDDDIVEEHNVPNQAFGLPDVGEMKVLAIKEFIYRQTGIEFKTNAEKVFRQRLSGIVFCMVDSMDTRKKIWESSIKLRNSVKHYIEPRMGLDIGRIYNINPMSLNQIEKYEATLYSDVEADLSACGVSMTVISTAMLITSYCTRQLIELINGQDLDSEILIDAKYNNIITTKWSEI